MLYILNKAMCSLYLHLNHLVQTEEKLYTQTFTFVLGYYPIILISSEMFARKLIQQFPALL